MFFRQETFTDDEVSGSSGSCRDAYIRDQAPIKWPGAQDSWLRASVCYTGFMVGVRVQQLRAQDHPAFKLLMFC